MNRFLTACMLAFASSLSRADVTFDFTTQNGRNQFTASAPTDGSWYQDNTNGFILGQTASANIRGTGTLTQNSAIQMGQTGTARVLVNHYWGFAPNDGARLAYSNDGSTWNYALNADFTAQGYNSTSTLYAGDGNQTWGGSVGGAAGAQVTSIYQFNVTDPNLNYFFRFESKLSGATDYVTDDIWGIKSMTVSVPEPGTMLLGGIAAVSGGAGAWWKRRRKKAAAKEDETPVESTTAV